MREGGVGQDPLLQFARRLRDLHGQAGAPSRRDLEKLTDRAGHRYPRATISDKLAGTSLPDWEFVKTFVAACALTGHAPEQDLQEWQAEHRALLRAVGARRAGSRQAGHAVTQLAGAPLAAIAEGTLHATAGLSVPLEIAIRDPRPVFTNVLKYEFEGRKRLLEQVSTFVDRESCGFFWIEAEAGLGKTAIAAHLAREHGWICHFARHMRNGWTVRGALRNLAAQLVDRYELVDIAPARMLPEWSSTPEGFESLLSRAAARARSGGHKLVLVVDGADEAEKPQGMLPWALPTTLPADVFVIGTYRTGYPPVRCENARVYRIEAGEHSNLTDIEAFLHMAVSSVELARRLSEANIPPAVFIRQLAERCGGVWIYLRYVLDEVRLGLRTVDDLADLPSDLTSFYAYELARWQKTPEWSAGLSRVLAVLAVGGEPLSPRVLSSMSGSDPDRVQRWCDYLLRPFLSATAEPQRRFELYHGSLRSYLTGNLSEHDVADEHRAWAQVLRKGAARAHSQIAEHYLQIFGGLDNGLPTLDAKIELAGQDDGYALRHLARHLIQVGRVDDLHHLLTLEHGVESGRSTNLWFAAHDWADSLDDYLRDLALARMEREAATNRAVDRGEPGPALSSEWRYALLAASITSLTDNLVPELMVRLLTTDMWSPQKAFTSARRITSPLDRAAALTAIAPHLPADLKSQTLVYALAAIVAVADDGYRAERLVDIAPRLTPENVTAALDIAVSIKSEQCRAQALAGLSPRLTHGQLSTALAVVSQIVHCDYLAEALGALGPYLAPHQMTRALEIAASIWQELPRAKALVDLAPHLDSGQLDRALEVAIAMPLREARYRAQALTGIAPYLRAEVRSDVVTDALDTVRRIPADHGWARAEALASLAPQLTGEQLAQAMDIAAEIPHKDSRARALAMLAPHLTEDQLARSLQAAMEINSLRDLARLLPYLPPEQRSAVLGHLLQDARSVVADYADHGVLPILVPQLRHDQLTQLLDVACTMRHGGGPLVLLAPYLSRDQLERALHAASIIKNGADRARTLSGLAFHLTNEQLNQALEAASSITDNRQRLRAIAGLAPYLTSEQLPTAAAISSAIADDGAAAIAVAGLTGYVPASKREAILARAEIAVTAVANPADRARMLTRMAPHVGPDSQASFVEQALTAVGSLPEHERVNALIELVPLLDSSQLVSARALTAQIRDSDHRARAMAGLIQRLPARYVAEQLVAAITIANDYERADALSELLPLLNPRQLTHALDGIAAISSAYPRGETLAAIAPYLPASRLDEALVMATELEDIPFNHYQVAKVLTLIGPRLPRDQRPLVLARALDQADRVDEPSNRALALGRLVAHLDGSQRSRVLADALEAAGYASGYELAFILITMAPGLSNSELGRLLDVAIAIDDDDSRAEALIGLGPHLSPKQLAQVLETVRILSSFDDRIRALAGLAPYLPLEQLMRAIESVPSGRDESSWNPIDNSQALSALITRADELTCSGDEECYVSLLRATLRASSRDSCLRLTATCASALNRIAGSAAIAEIIESIEIVRRWWP